MYRCLPGFKIFEIRKPFFSESKKISSETPTVFDAFSKLKEKSNEILSYCRNSKMNDQICFLIDMNIDPGNKRFFVFDLRNKKVTDSGLVTHGRFNERWLEGRKYSNIIGSGCTAPGKYKIGNSYVGRFGLAFKLHGLDTTNNNAYKRFIVLHSHPCVPEEKVSPLPVCQSDGCPTVSPGFLTRLKIEEIGIHVCFINFS
jgi:hypothetical protein